MSKQMDKLEKRTDREKRNEDLKEVLESVIDSCSEEIKYLLSVRSPKHQWFTFRRPLSGIKAALRLIDKLDKQ